MFPQVGIQSKGHHGPASAQEAAVGLPHLSVVLTQSILGQQRQCSGVCEEQREPEAMS